MAGQASWPPPALRAELGAVSKQRLLEIRTKGLLRAGAHPSPAASSPKCLLCSLCLGRRLWLLGRVQRGQPVPVCSHGILVTIHQYQHFYSSSAVKLQIASRSQAFEPGAVQASAGSGRFSAGGL